MKASTMFRIKRRLPTARLLIFLVCLCVDISKSTNPKLLLEELVEKAGSRLFGENLKPDGTGMASEMKLLADDMDLKLEALGLASNLAYQKIKSNSIERCLSDWIEINNTCFKLPVYSKLDWSGAQKLCQLMGGHLANVESNSRGKAILAVLNETLGDTFANKAHDIWMGGFGFLTESTWFLTNGEPIGIESDWKAFEGVDVIERDSYHRCYAYSEGLYSRPCFAKLHFLCEREKM